MSESREIRLHFERFADAGEKHSFRLRSGQDFLGWIIEVGEDAVLVAWAPTPFYAQANGKDEMSPPDEWVRFAKIDHSSLSYWDHTTCRWVDFPYVERAGTRE